MSIISQSKTGYDHDNLRHVVITSTCFAFILSTTAVGFRIISRKINGNGLYLDDLLIISALIFEYGITIAGIVLLYNGLGTHIAYVKPEQLVVYLKTLFTGSILYTCCIASVKLSILMLYRRIFPTKQMKIGVNIVSMIVILWAACGILTGCFTCIPTEKLWYPELPGGCMDLSKFYYGLQVPNIATDAIILFMPMHVVWGLPISRTQKFGLSAIFILGFLTLVFDIVRLVALIDLSTAGNDITYNQVNSSVWTCIEPAVGIVAACLSNMRPLFKIVHTKLWSRIGSTAGSSQQEIISANGEKGWTRNTPSLTNTINDTTHSESPARSPSV
ncbi:uncharacterized protein N7498_000787 [Penicillium cinerascens]|uniref:Rhodopsin domain-containing protein n=1 Tax=Penicillium cinerascens TaxID=70096 RepID=A0A9W9TDF9_9EURO|nr:uncharacterized protein N7498_000787 [Penicillium cinerascens]KAJ5218688.1 hypothetical protein N7498_000787 [Penicillium cinerascens]